MLLISKNIATELFRKLPIPLEVQLPYLCLRL